MTYGAEQDKQAECNRNSFLSIKETTMNCSKISSRTNIALSTNTDLALPVNSRWSKNICSPLYLQELHMKEKGLGEVSAIRPGKAKESKKETEQNQHASSSLWWAKL